MIPSVRKRPRMGVRQPYLLRCPGHVRDVKRRNCCVNNHECSGPIDAHHVKEGVTGAGTTNHDSAVVPLCRWHHNRGESPGWSWKRFEAHYHLDLSQIAADLWRLSKHRILMERKMAAAGQ